MGKDSNVVYCPERGGSGVGKRWLKSIAFILLFFLIFAETQFVLQDKWYTDSNSFARIKLFFKEDQAPDVVFIGSSQVYFGINPLHLFKDFGISSYDYAPPNQSMEVTALYVEKTIEKYSPKLLVLEPTRCFDFPLNEQRARWWLDPMPMSLSKMRTINALYSENERFDLGFELGSRISWVTPLLRYHDRWGKLSAYDFVLDQRLPYYHGAEHYHGYGTHFNTSSADFSGYNDAVTFNNAILAEARQYFDRITNMCVENGTKLLIVKTPSGLWRQDYHDLIASWADDYDVPFMDYNDCREVLGIDSDKDYANINHLNDSGATKLTVALGQYLKDHYDLPDHRGDPVYADWDDDWQVYQQDRASWFLSHETNWESYVGRLQNPNYTVYIAARGSLGGDKHPELMEQFKTLGLTPELDTAARMGYAAVIDRGEVVYEALEDAPVSYEEDVNGHHVELASASYSQGNRASIELDWQERFINHRGVGIVVYDNLLEDIVDRVTFDLWDGGKAYR